MNWLRMFLVLGTAALAAMVLGATFGKLMLIDNSNAQCAVFALCCALPGALLVSVFDWVMILTGRSHWIWRVWV